MIEICRSELKKNTPKKKIIEDLLDKIIAPDT